MNNDIFHSTYTHANKKEMLLEANEKLEPAKGDLKDTKIINTYLTYSHTFLTKSGGS